LNLSAYLTFFLNYQYYYSGEESNFVSLARTYTNSVKTLTTLIEFVSESRTNVPLKFTKCPFEVRDFID